MKKLFTLLFLALCISSRAQIITATVTVTNAAGTVNGDTIQVNGHLRTWTNNVTSANIQIQTTNSIGAAATNLFYAYVTFPEAQITVRLNGTNQILLQSYSGFPNTVIIGSNWASVSFTTNSVTNMTVFRGFYSLVGSYEQTNTANGIVSFLGSGAITNAIPVNAPAMTNYATNGQFTSTFTTLSNLVLVQATNSTNFTLSTSNSLYTEIVAATNGIESAAYQPASAFQPSCVNLSNWCGIATNALAGLSYLDGSGNIILADGTPQTRLEADKGGAWNLYWEDGTGFFYTDTGHNLQFKDHAGTVRIEVDDAATSNGQTVIRNSTGQDDIKIDGVSAVQKNYADIAFNEQTQPAVAIGTVTNFIADAPNSGSSVTAVNSFTFPGNTFSHNSDSITVTFGIVTAANSNVKTVQFYFDSADVIQASTSTSAASFYGTVTITRSSSATYVSMGSISTGSGGLGSTPGVSDAWAVKESMGTDFTNPKECHISVQGTSSSDITVVLERIEFKPSHDYAY